MQVRGVGKHHLNVAAFEIGDVQRFGPLERDVDLLASDRVATTKLVQRRCPSGRWGLDVKLLDNDRLAFEDDNFARFDFLCQHRQRS